MSKVKIKRFRMFAMREDEEKFIKELQKLGCMQIMEHKAAERGFDREGSERLKALQAELDRVSSALKLLDKYVYPKDSRSRELPQMKLSQLFDGALPDRAAESLELVERGEAALAAIYAEEKKSKTGNLRSHRERLRMYYDRLRQETEAAAVKNKLLLSELVFFLEGWVAEPELPELEKLLAAYCCAYEALDPEPEEDAPVWLDGRRREKAMIKGEKNIFAPFEFAGKYTEIIKDHHK